MPLDDGPTQSPPHEDWGFTRISQWRLKFCFVPKTCWLTHRRLWLEHAYQGVHMITVPGTPVLQEYYVDKNEFIIAKLKGKV